MFYVMCSTYCVCMFLCSLYAPTHQNKFQVDVNLLGNKYYSDSPSFSPSPSAGHLNFLKSGPPLWHGGLVMVAICLAKPKAGMTHEASSSPWPWPGPV